MERKCIQFYWDEIFFRTWKLTERISKNYGTIEVVYFIHISLWVRSNGEALGLCSEIGESREHQQQWPELTSIIQAIGLKAMM
jgi:hypothetical protein